jgi:hypothetical protein
MVVGRTTDARSGDLLMQMSTDPLVPAKPLHCRPASVRGLGAITPAEPTLRWRTSPLVIALAQLIPDGSQELVHLDRFEDRYCRGWSLRLPACFQSAGDSFESCRGAAAHTVTEDADNAQDANRTDFRIRTNAAWSAGSFAACTAGSRNPNQYPTPWSTTPATLMRMPQS